MTSHDHVSSFGEKFSASESATLDLLRSGYQGSFVVVAMLELSYFVYFLYNLSEFS